MRAEHSAIGLAEQLAGRLLRRALLALVIAILALVAIYYFTGAGLLGLEAEYGALYGHLIMGGIFAAVALIGVIVWLVQGKSTSAIKTAIGHTREMRVAMLVEAAMLGYAMARRGRRTP